MTLPDLELGLGPVLLDLHLGWLLGLFLDRMTRPRSSGTCRFQVPRCTRFAANAFAFLKKVGCQILVEKQLIVPSMFKQGLNLRVFNKLHPHTPEAVASVAENAAEAICLQEDVAGFSATSFSGSRASRLQLRYDSYTVALSAGKARIGHPCGGRSGGTLERV